MRTRMLSTGLSATFTVIILLTYRAHAGNYTFIPLGQPGDIQSVAEGINDADQIVGLTYTTAGNGGFVWANGTRNQVAAGPLIAVNELGLAAGQTGSAGSRKHNIVFTYDLNTGQQTIYDMNPRYDFIPLCNNDAGFVGGAVMLPHGKVKAFEIIRGKSHVESGPGTDTITEVYGISNDDYTVGQYVELNNKQKVFSFIYKAGRYTLISYPGARQTDAQWIKLQETVGGSYVDTAGNRHGFTRIGGVFASYDYPGATATSAVGLTKNGVVAGNWSDKTNPGSGFVELNGAYHTIAFPGAYMTAISGMNNHGDLVGYYKMQSYLEGQAFVALCPTSAPCTK